MDTRTQTLAAFSAASIILATLIPPAQAQTVARGHRGAFGARGAYAHQGLYGSSAGMGRRVYGLGTAGVQGGSFSGPNGGSFAGARGGIVGRNAGLVGRGFQATGPNGGSASGGGVAGFRRGVGGFEQTAHNVTGPNGSTFAGTTKGVYNAQTGQGTFNGSKQVYDAKNGKDYGYTDSSTFTKGEGGTTSLNTDNHGDYTVDWGGGQKPVVTPVAQPGN